VVARVALSFPERVGSYELFAPIGAGGMATVYLGVAERTGGFQRQVAIKMIHGTHDSDPQLAADLLREAKLAARIRHPNVVPVLDVGEDPSGLFLVMDYIEGDNVAGLRRTAARLGERVPVEIALRVATDALAGLHAAHELTEKNGQLIGVVHRDFSPQNILVGIDGVTRLTDFGIAKIAMTAGHTRTGKIKGKIAYMSPEQARGVKVDRRCDIWAAGVVVWELLTGERLYESEDEIGLLLKIVNENPRRLRQLCPDLPPALDEALAYALTPDLDARCPTADELRKLLLKSHPIADSATVGEWATRIAGPKLEARERKVNEIRELRAEGQRSGEVSAPHSTTSGAPPQADLVAASETVTRVREDTTDATVAWQPSEASGEIHGDGSGAVPGLDTTGSRTRRNHKRALAIGIASGLFVSLLVVIGIGASRKPEEAVPVAAAEAPPPRLLVPEAKEQSAQNAATQSFVVKGNADIVALTVAGKSVELAGAVQEVQLPELPQAGDVVEATAVDGRKAKATVAADKLELRIDFPVLRPTAKPATAKTATAKTAKAPPAKSSGTTAPPFAKNPYK
jgi:serine/threonine-protein kinase